MTIFLFAAGGRVSVRWLELPLIILMLLVFVCGLAMLLSSLFVKYRDVEPIWDVVTQALFYGTPILYSISVVIDKAGIEVARLMLVNPVATAIQQARHAMVDAREEQRRRTRQKSPAQKARMFQAKQHRAKHKARRSRVGGEGW